MDAFKVLLVGCGGVGNEVLYRVWRYFRERLRDTSKIDCQGFDFELRPQGQEPPVYRDFEIEDAARVVAKRWETDSYFRVWWPQSDGQPYKYSGAIDANTKGAQIRANGRLAGAFHAENIRRTVKDFFAKHTVADKGGEPKRPQFLVIVVSTLAGGTGSGLLQEVVFACREEMRPADLLIGAFMDGSVVEKWAAGTAPLGYASLVEMEHWMTRAGDYYRTPISENLKRDWDAIVGRTTGGADGLDEMGYFDHVFLLQRMNENRQELGGRRSGQVKIDYAELTAGALYSLLAGELMQADAGKGKNVLGIFENKPMNVLRRREPVVNGRAFKYGSMGVCLLSVPVRKIAEYLAGDRIVAAFNSAKSGDSQLAAAANYLSSRNLDENLNQLAEQCRKTEAYIKLSRRITRVAAEVAKSGKHGDLLKKISTHGLDDPESGWEPWLTAYETSMRARLAELLSSESRQLDDAIAAMLKSSHPARVLGWLKDLEERVRACKEKKSPARAPRPAADSPVRASDWKAAIRDSVEVLAKANAWQRVARLGELRDRLVVAVQGIKQEATRRETQPLDEFYAGLLRETSLRASCLSAIVQALDNVEDHHRKTVAAFTVRDSFIDPEKLNYNEHPLELEIGTHQSFLDSARQRLLNRPSDEEILAWLVEPVEDVEHRLSWAGLPEFYKQVVKGSPAVSKDGTTNYQKVESDYNAVVTYLLDRHVVGRVQQLLAEQFTLWSALESFLDEKRKLCAGYSETAPQAKQILADLRTHFGENGANELLNDRTAKPENWRDKAVTLLAQRLVGFSSPFWRVDQTAQKEAEELAKAALSADFPHQVTNIYAPQDELVQKLVKNMDLLKQAKVSGVYSMPDRHLMSFISLRYAYPLFVLTEMERVREDYLKHIDDWNKGVASTPIHVDNRFYGIWRDDIQSPSAQSRDREDEIALAYLLAMGSGVLSLSRAANGSKFAYKGKTFAPGLTKLVSKLREKAETLRTLLGDVEGVLGNDLYDASRGKQAAQEKVWGVFEKAGVAHASIRPPKTDTGGAFALWDGIAKDGKVERGADGVWRPDGRLAPKNREDFDRLLQMLRRHVK